MTLYMPDAAIAKEFCALYKSEPKLYVNIADLKDRKLNTLSKLNQCEASQEIENGNIYYIATVFGKHNNLEPLEEQQNKRGGQLYIDLTPFANNKVLCVDKYKQPGMNEVDLYYLNLAINPLYKSLGNG